MGLDTAKLITDVLAACCLLCAVLLAVVSSTAVRLGLVAAVIVLIILLAVVNVLFLRCPFCNGPLARWQMDECPNCGSELKEDVPAEEEGEGGDVPTSDSAEENPEGEKPDDEPGFYI